MTHFSAVHFAFSLIGSLALPSLSSFYSSLSLRNSPREFSLPHSPFLLRFRFRFRFIHHSLNSDPNVVVFCSLNLHLWIWLPISVARLKKLKFFPLLKSVSLTLSCFFFFSNRIVIFYFDFAYWNAVVILESCSVRVCNFFCHENANCYSRNLDEIV